MALLYLVSYQTTADCHRYSQEHRGTIAGLDQNNHGGYFFREEIRLAWSLS